MAKDDFFGELDKLLENEYAGVADDGTSADVVGFLDTGSYILNALYSGSIFRGMPANKISALAGEESTGKTFFMLAILKNFLDSDAKAVGIIFESEGSITKEIMSSRGIDTKRVYIVPVETIQQFKTQAVRIVEKHLKTPEKEKRPLLMALDSLGMLSTTKEMADTESGKETKDMTRTQEIKAAFRVLTLKLSKAGIPLLVTNHVYQSVGSFFPTKEMSGGCLTKNEKIQMSDNSLKNIQDVVIGDMVKTLEGNKEVSNTFIFDNKELYELELEDGKVIKCSSNHKFLMFNGEWVTAEQIFTMAASGKDIHILTHEEYVNICLTTQNIQVGISI